MGSGLVEVGPGASTWHRLPPLPRGPWAAVRTTAESSPVASRLLDCGMPAVPALPLCQSPGLGFGFLPVVFCLFTHSCPCTFTHSFSAQSSAGAERAGPESQSWLSAPALCWVSGGKPLNPAGVVLLLGLSGGWGSGESACSGRSVPVVRVRPSPAHVRRRAPSALLEWVPPFPAYSWPMGTSGRSWPRPPRAAILTGIIRPSPTAIHAERVHLAHMRAPQARLQFTSRTCALPKHACLHAPRARAQEQRILGSHTQFLRHRGDAGHTCVAHTPPLHPRAPPARVSLPRCARAPVDSALSAPLRVHRCPCPAVPAPACRPVFVFLTPT